MKRLLQLYADELSVHLAEGTTKTRLRHARLLCAWLEARGVELGGVRGSDLHAYQSALLLRRTRAGHPYAAGSQANEVASMKRLFGFLHARGYLLADPAARLSYPRVGQRLPRVLLSEGEVVRILEAPEAGTPRGLRDRALLETLYATGLRAGELCRLTVYDVDLDERVVRVVMGKGRKDRVVPLTHKAARALERYLAQGRPKLLVRPEVRWLFLGGRGGLLRNCMLNWTLKRWAERAGVKKNVSPHTLRHSVATHLLKHRADIRHIQALLGHRSLSTTERYTRVEVSDLKQVLRRAHPRGR